MGDVQQVLCQCVWVVVKDFGIGGQVCWVFDVVVFGYYVFQYYQCCGVEFKVVVVQ